MTFADYNELRDFDLVQVWILICDGWTVKREQAAKRFLFHKFTSFVILLDNNSAVESINNELQLQLNLNLLHPLHIILECIEIQSEMLKCNRQLMFANVKSQYKRSQIIQ